jgi:hypothetical protein
VQSPSVASVGRYGDHTYDVYAVFVITIIGIMKAAQSLILIDMFCVLNAE